MTNIAFEQQQRPRLCGAAALTMAYRSLGLAVTQDEIWPSIAGKNGRGDDCARTHRLAADALKRGLAALVIQARDPWDILRHDPQHVRMILNHRPQEKAWTGHYTVRIERGDDALVVHDPQFGPHRRLKREEFLRLWLRTANPLCEISGNLLVALAKSPGADEVCAACRAPVPASLACPGCRLDVPLWPAALVGCATPDCGGRRWERLFCPHCDFVMLGPTAPLAGQSPAMSPLCAGVGAGAGAPPLVEAMERFKATLSQAAASCGPGEGQHMLRRAGDDLTQHFDAVLPELHKAYEGSQKALAELQAHGEKLKAKPPARKPVPPARRRRAAIAAGDIDPQLGQKLRVQLLEELRQSLVGATAKPAADLSEDAWQGWIENSSIGFTPDAVEQAAQLEAARKRAAGFGRKPPPVKKPAANPQEARPAPRAKPTSSDNPDGGAWEDWIEGTSWS